MGHRKHKKTINGHVVITIRLPHTFEVDTVDEVYEDEHGKEYTEEEYEYSVEDVLKYNPNEHAQEINKDIQYLKNRGWTVEEIAIEEH